VIKKKKVGKTFETKRLQELEEIHFRLTNLNQIRNCTEMIGGERQNSHKIFDMFLSPQAPKSIQHDESQ
jgi:hypothetical protein